MAQDNVQWLYERSDQLASTLNRNWILQAGIGALGFLHAIDPTLAAELAKTLKIGTELIQYTVPVIGLYLFARMGYLLGGYILTRSSLQDELDRHSNIPRLAAQNYSLFALIALAGDKRETWAPKHDRLRDYLLGILPAFVLVISLFIVICWNNAFTVYFTYELVPVPKSWPIWSTWISPLLVGLIITSLYVQFIYQLDEYLKKYGKMLIGGTLAVAIALGALIFFIWDPGLDARTAEVVPKN